MTETKHERKQYTVRFPHEAAVVLDEMAEEEKVPIPELVWRAINFYQVKLDAKKDHKQILLEAEDGGREWVPV